MLVLARNVGEWIICRCPDGTEIRICVTQAGVGCARLGFLAPKAANIARAEVYDPAITETSKDRAGEGCPRRGAVPPPATFKPVSEPEGRVE